MVVSKPNLKNSAAGIVLTTSGYIIEQVQKVKALGIFITSGLTNHANINYIISKSNYQIAFLKEIFKFAEVRTKLILMNSLVVSVVRYGYPLIINSNANLISKLQTLFMKCT